MADEMLNGRPAEDFEQAPAARPVTTLAELP